MKIEHETDSPTVLPLWKNCLQQMRDDGLEYGKVYPVEYFEKFLRATRDQQSFIFEMMNLKQTVEKEDGYYLKQINSGSEYMIQTAAGHEEEAHRFDSKVRRYAVRSVNLRAATLMNPKAELTDGERAKMEKSLEIASTRLVLMSRQKRIAETIATHAPKLLHK